MTTPTQTVMSESVARDFTPPDTSQSVRRIFSIVGAQAVAGSAVAAMVWALFGGLPGFSALLGAGVYLIPALAFATFVAAGIALGRAPKVQLHNLYVGEVFKLAVTVILFTVVFAAVKPLDPLFFLTGFIVTQATMIAVLLRG